MINIAKVRARLNQIEQLLLSFRQVSHAPEEIEFSERINIIRHALDSFQGEVTETTKESEDSKLLLKDVEAKIISFMLKRLKIEMELPDAKKPLIEEHLKQLSSIQTELLASKKPNEKISIALMNDFFHTYSDLTSFPTAVLASNTAVVEAVHHKKKSARLVEIAPGFINEQQLKKDLLHTQIDEQELKLLILNETFNHLLSSNNSATDPLIKTTVDEVTAAQQALARLKNEKDLLNVEFELIRASSEDLFRYGFKILDDSGGVSSYHYPSMDLDDATREKIVKFLTFFSLSEHTRNELTVEDFELLQKKTHELDIKYAHKTPFKLMALVLKSDKQYLEKQIECAALVRKATDLMTQRCDELDQIDGKITASSTTGRGIQRLRADLQRLENEANELNQEIKKIFHTIVVSPEDKDRSITRLWDIHNNIYTEKKQAMKKRNSVCANLNLPDAFLDIPLEADRLLAKIETTQQLINSLTLVKSRLSTHSSDLSAAIEKRDGLALTHQHTLEQMAHEALHNIQRMKEVPAYIARFNVEMDKATDNINLLLRDIQVGHPGHIASIPHPLSEEEITERLTVGVKKIHTFMEPVLTQLKAENNEYMNMIDITKNRLDRLKIHITQNLPSQMDQFTHLHEIDTALLMLGRFKTDDVTTLDYHHLTAIQDEIVAEEARAAVLLDKIKSRKGAVSAQVIQQMIVSIGEEMLAMKDKKNNEPTLLILTNVQVGLQQSLDRYFQLKSDEIGFITESTNTLQTHLSRSNLGRLSDDAINPLVSFIRKLLKPLVQLIKGFTGESYRPNFFAKPIETNVAKAAQTADKALKLIKKNILAIEVPVSGPTNRPLNN